MSTKEIIREVLEPVAKSHDITIVDIVFHSGSVIEIPIMFSDKSMDLETCGMMADLFEDALENVEGMNYGDLVEVNEDKITISYMEKTRSKKMDIDTDNIGLIRLAIKL